MGGQVAQTSPFGRGNHVVLRQDATVPGIFQRQQPSPREVEIVRLDGLVEQFQRQTAIGGIDDRLRLNRTQHRCATTLVLVGMRFCADEVFVAAFAVAEQRDEVGLGSARCEHAGIEVEVVS